MSEREFQKSVASGFEIADTNNRLIAWGAVAVIVAALILHWILGAWFFHLKRQFTWRENPAPLPGAPPDYRASGAALAASVEGARKTLNSYEWIDPKNGIVRIPIEQAIKRMSHEK